MDNKMEEFATMLLKYWNGPLQILQITATCIHSTTCRLPVLPTRNYQILGATVITI